MLFKYEVSIELRPENVTIIIVQCYKRIYFYVPAVTRVTIVFG